MSLVTSGVRSTSYSNAGANPAGSSIKGGAEEMGDTEEDEHCFGL